MEEKVVSPYKNINQGTIAVESTRAMAEAQGKLTIAKMFPRDEIAAYSEAMRACQRKELAEEAFYSYNRGGETVTGASIRFAEELARCWGNIDYGIKEMSQESGRSEMQAYAWDLQTNTISVQNFTNRHVRETKTGIKTLTSVRDIYEVNANMAARRLRARILAILPKYLVSDCIEECKKTLESDGTTPFIDRVRKLYTNLERLGTTQAMIETRLGHKIDNMTPQEFVEYCGIFNSLKDHQTSIADWFDVKAHKNDEQSLNALISDAMNGKTEDDDNG